MVVGFLLVVGTGIRAALRARSEFSQLAAVGFTAILGFQSFFIMAGVVRLLPLTGVSLPFIGYGGSSLVANYVLVALLMRISDEGAAPPGVAIGLAHRAARMRRRALVTARAAPVGAARRAGPGAGDLNGSPTLQTRHKDAPADRVPPDAVRPAPGEPGRPPDGWPF